MRYEPMHMHIHTCHQPGGSMEGHIYNASLLGMKYIRFTDHDTRTGRKQDPIEDFDFSKNVAMICGKPKGNHGFEFFGEPDVSFCSGKMTIRSTADTEEYHRSGAYFTSGRKHTVSLLAEVKLILGLRIKTLGDAHVYLDIKLSQRPPDHSPAHLIYSFDGYGGQNGLHTVRLPKLESESGIYELAISDDIREIREIGGLDNVFDTVFITSEVRNGGSAEITLDRFEIKAKYGYNDVIVRQRRLADEIGARYGIKPFVTTEISGAGQHKNVFSTSVPVINYEELGYSVSEREAAEHVLSHGGIFAYNHPLENSKFKKLKDITPKEAEIYAINEAASLISTRLFGAHLMEVGFPEGRRVFTLYDHLRLWDIISLAGLFITGYGDSDSHYNDRNWFDGNNFASWIAVGDDSAFPVSEDELIRSMKAGNVYMGDPVHLKSEISFSSGDAPMGSVILTNGENPKMTFRVAFPTVSSTVRVIVNGRVFKEERITSPDEFVLNFEFKPEYAVSFARVEMYNPDGRCIMLTNPIYIVDRDVFRGYIPTERLVKER